MIKNFLDTLKKPSGEGIKSDELNKILVDDGAETQRTGIVYEDPTEPNPFDAPDPAAPSGTIGAETVEQTPLPSTPAAHVGQEAIKAVQQPRVP